MKALIDCNSFYCSCERVFRPDLYNQPVVVLSNNDGCIIARSNEAKALGVAMGEPYFKAKPLIEQFGVATFSSNYHLYGNFSWRVMETLRMLIGKTNVEVYSVDEAFLNLDDVPDHLLLSTAKNIKDTVEMWTGIKVSIGVGRTKVLSKVANRLAKKVKESNGIMALMTVEQERNALQNTPISDIWGIGHQYAEKLKTQNISNAYQLSLKDETWARKYLGGITGQRLLRELKGITSILMADALVDKKMIATTRMFGNPVSNIKDLKEAIATYTSRTAEKLRRQHSAATIINVFVVPKEPVNNARFRHGPSIGAYTTLPSATSITHQLIKPALQLVDQLYEKGRFYKKAGVTLSGLVNDNFIQGNLFAPELNTKSRYLMAMLDNINFAMRDDIVKYAASGTTKNWKMRQELRSPRYTTRWNELYNIN